MPRVTEYEKQQARLPRSWDPNIKPEELLRRFRRDVLLTYPYSNGSSELQTEVLLPLLAVHYQASLSDPELEFVPRLLPALRLTTVNIRPPGGGHPDTVRESDAAVGVWSALKEQLETLRPGNTPSATRIRALHRKAAELIVDKDLEYLDFRPFVLKTEGRPNRKPGQDPWQSHYHDFVLDNPPTDSDAIDTILARLRQNHRDAYEAGVDEPVPGFNKLRGVWVAKHQGESFYPDSFFAPPEQQMPTIDELLVRQSAGCCVRTCVTL